MGVAGHLQLSHAQVMVTVNLFTRSLYTDVLELSHTGNSSIAMPIRAKMSRTIRT